MSIRCQEVNQNVNTVKFGETKCQHEKKKFFFSNRQEIQIVSTASPGYTYNDYSKKVNLAYISYEKNFQKKFFFPLYELFVSPYRHLGSPSGTI